MIGHRWCAVPMECALLACSAGSQEPGVLSMPADACVRWTSGTVGA
jgi:hypothetical protein